jgi:hypothetical protein
LFLVPIMPCCRDGDKHAALRVGRLLRLASLTRVEQKWLIALRAPENALLASARNYASG